MISSAQLNSLTPPAHAPARRDCVLDLRTGPYARNPTRIRTHTPRAQCGRCTHDGYVWSQAPRLLTLLAPLAEPIQDAAHAAGAVPARRSVHVGGADSDQYQPVQVDRRLVLGDTHAQVQGQRVADSGAAPARVYPRRKLKINKVTASVPSAHQCAFPQSKKRSCTKLTPHSCCHATVPRNVT